MNKLLINIILFVVLQIPLYSNSYFSEQNIKQAISSYINENIDEYSDFEILTNIKSELFSFKNVKAIIRNKNNRFEGLLNLEIVYSDNDRILKVTDVKVKINKYKKVYVAKNDISKGQIIKETDIEEKLVEQFINQNLNIQEIIGKRASSNIAKGLILKSNHLEKDYLVKKGDTIIIIVQSGAVVIKTLGKSLDDGSIGDEIRVIRDNAVKKILNGKIQEDGTVLISNSELSRGITNVKN
jgi:flagella basal body P-ring formation protein FlgA